MSNGSRKADASPTPGPQQWTAREAYLLAMVCLFVGVIAGYLLRGSGSQQVQSPAAPAAAPASAPQALQSPQSLDIVVQPMLDALRADPRNADALIKLGNTYYDHQFYNEAIKYYERALEVRPDNVNVRTDLGTAYFYTGSPKKAIEQFQKSLAINPTHAQTLFNLGIVKKEGLSDPAGAIAAWEQLLKTNPNYPEKERVLQLITDARSQKSSRN